MSLLQSIDHPKDLRALPRTQLKQVAKEVRDLILKVVPEKGGHLASNLGTVELTVALHYVFNTPQDKLVWDVGHQSYPHKILTGRRDRFSTIRQQHGLSGFTSRAESEFDHFGAGHASTSISAALGIAEGLRHKGQPNLAIAVIGDGSMTGGLAYEALNNAGHIPAKNLLVVLNDNDMSIDPNVGAVNSFINQTVTHPGYNRLRRDLRDFIASLSHHGVDFAAMASRMRKSIKNFFTPGMLFECFGFRYFGPINGHDVDALVETLEFIRKEGPEGGPYLVHALTVKGKGYKPAEERPLKYHGVSPFKVELGIPPTPSSNRKNYQDVFAETLIRLAKEDPRVVAITAAMPSGTGINRFQSEFPGRTYDVGIAEAHAVLFAAGLATEGYRPVAAIYSTFLQRAYDQVIHDVALQNLPVIFAMDRAGLVGADGATHQGAFDLSYLRTVPGFVVMAPKDENELQHMLKTAVDHQSGPIALRYPRGEVQGVAMDSALKAIPIGKGEVLATEKRRPKDPYDVVLIGLGAGVQIASQALPLLRKEGLRVGVLNARFLKPLDDALMLKWLEQSRLAVTIEENNVKGGFGSAILELASENRVHTEIMVCGIPDIFVDHASPAAQREISGLNPQQIAEKVIARLEVESKELPSVRVKPSPSSLTSELIQ